MTEVDPGSPEDERTSVLGGREMPGTGDPTDGGKHGEIGEVPSISSDEPDDGGTYPVGGAAGPGSGA